MQKRVQRPKKMSKEVYVDHEAVSALESDIFAVIKNWSDAHEYEKETKRHTIGLILLRALGCIVSTEDSDEKAEEMLMQINDELKIATKMVKDGDLSNPLRDLKNEAYF